MGVNTMEKIYKRWWSLIIALIVIVATVAIIVAHAEDDNNKSTINSSSKSNMGINLNTQAIKDDIIVKTKIGIENIIGITEDTQDDDPGITKISDVNNQYIINYNFCPIKTNGLTQEIGYTLSEDIEQIYKSYNNVDKLKFVASKPKIDTDGVETWKPFITFETSRKIYKKIDWDYFDGAKLIDVAENVKQLR